MGSETAAPAVAEGESATGRWIGGLVGGLVGGVVFGVLLAASAPAVLEAAIPAMYGLQPPNGAAGVAIHLAHGAVLGVGFAALAGAVGLEGLTAGRWVGGGLAYGLLAWLVLAVVVMPVWLAAVGFGAAPDPPNVDATSLVGHAAYGAFLGAGYYAVEG